MELKEQIINEIKKIYDPEIPVNIYELGLIYDINVDKDNMVKIKMTLTTPNCPVAESLPKEVKDSVKEVKNVKDVELDLVWDPPWDKSMMSEAAKLELNLLHKSLHSAIELRKGVKKSCQKITLLLV